MRIRLTSPFRQLSNFSIRFSHADVHFVLVTAERRVQPHFQFPHTNTTGENRPICPIGLIVIYIVDINTRDRQ